MADVTQVSDAQRYGQRLKIFLGLMGVPLALFYIAQIMSEHGHIFLALRTVLLFVYAPILLFVAALFPQLLTLFPSAGAPIFFLLTILVQYFIAPIWFGFGTLGLLMFRKSPPQYKVIRYLSIFAILVAVLDYLPFLLMR